jgi:predicted Zn-dependent protease
MDSDVTAVGEKLAVSNRHLCSRLQWRPGFTLHDRMQYSEAHRGAAVRLFGLAGGAAILAVAPLGAAARAGLRANDVVLSVDGLEVTAPDDKVQSFDRVAELTTLMEQGFSDGQASLSISRAGREILFRVQGEQGCATRFQVVPKAGLNAWADGTYVQITSALVHFTRDEDELAAVLAHEFAHNVLEHKDHLEREGRSLGRVRTTEAEADQLSVRLMANAGYDPTAAVRFWRRFGARTFDLFGSLTHASARKRIRMMEKEIAFLRRATAPPVSNAERDLSANQP